MMLPVYFELARKFPVGLRFDADGQLVGRTQWDAPDVDPLVFISDPDPESGAPPAAPGTMVRCVVTSASLFDLEATPVSGPI